ncbi:MAG: hypothetical protein ACR2RE_07410 [Geminicoccaceae bacterium]
MPVILYNATSEASLDAKLALANGGTLEIRDAAQPAVNVAPAGNLVLEYPMGSPAFANAVADGTSATAAANGLPVNDDALVTADLVLAGHGVIRDLLSNVVLTGNVGATGSGATFELADLNPTIGDTVALTAINASEIQQGS